MISYAMTHIADQRAVGSDVSSALAFSTYGKPRKGKLVVSGTPGTNATIDAKISMCDTAGGTYTDIASIPQITSAGTQEVAFVVDDGYQYFKVTITTGVAASVSSAVVIFDDERLYT